MYLVSGHKGWDYITDSDYDDIIHTCPQCRDSDTVEFGFDETDAYNEIIRYAESSFDPEWSKIMPHTFAQLCLQEGILTQEQFDVLCATRKWMKGVQ